MAQIQHLERAPIVEALVDFRVVPRPDFQTEAFLSLKEKLKATFPTVEVRRYWESRILLREGTAQVPETGRAGPDSYFFKSDDGLDIAQFRGDGLTFNRLAPYTRWEQIRAQSLALWSEYEKVAAPQKLERLALRYINRLKLPAGVEVSQFLGVLPYYFPGSPTHLLSFQTKVVSLDPSKGVAANISQTFDFDVDKSSRVVMLDIGVVTQAGLSLDPAMIGPKLDELHEMKNAIFFGSITDDTVRLYK